MARPLVTVCDAHKRVALSRAAAAKACPCSHLFRWISGSKHCSGSVLQQSRAQPLVVPVVPAFAWEPLIHLRQELRREHKPLEQTGLIVQRTLREGRVVSYNIRERATCPRPFILAIKICSLVQRAPLPYDPDPIRARS